jgi:transposase
MSQAALFPLPESNDRPERPCPEGVARIQQADRSQVRMEVVDLDSLLPADHRARAVWAFVAGLDLSKLYAKVRAVEGGAGRAPIDPKILLALWLYATVEGVGSARALDGLCDSHVAYRWLRGGVGVNYHTLSDFRTAHEAVLSELLTQSVAALMSKGLVELKRVAQDGVRVRAAAGAASFRRKRRLQQCLDEAREQVQRLRQELEEDPAATSRRQQAARERAARERQQRVEEALRQMPEVEEKKPADKREEARVSTTDADARVMKMPDGGYRPGFNVQFAADTGAQVVTGVEVTTVGSDRSQMEPMIEQHDARYHRHPSEVLVDGGFVKKEAIDAVTREGVTVYAPVQPSKKDTRDAYEPREDDSEAVAAWRRRMATEEAKKIYRERAATAECVNAAARNRGLRQFLVRGLGKVRCVALLFALAHNLMRTMALLG